MTEWADAAKIAFGLMVSAFVVSLLVYYFYVGRTINNEMSKQEANRELMREYREYSGYNDKVVYAQDVVSLIMQKRGSTAVRITVGGNTISYWADDDAEMAVGNIDTPWNLPVGAHQTDYTATAVTERLNINKSYKGTIAYGGNGEVVGVSFARGTANDDGTFTED